MRSAEDMKRLFKEAELTIHPDTDERVFQDVLWAQQNRNRNSPALPGKIWRMTMKNPIGRLAVAAVVVIASLIGLSLWKGTGSGVALADVLIRLGQVSAFMCQSSMTSTVQVAGMAVNSDMESTLLASHEQDLKMTMKLRGPGGMEEVSEMYILPQKGVCITVMPHQKKYMRIDYDETMLANLKKQNNDPRALVEMILRCKYQSLGRSVVDGVEVEGFQTTDPNYLSGLLGQADVKIWVDVKTLLPVRSEEDVHADQMQMHIVTHDFQWNIPASEADFEPLIPADYTEMPGGPVKLPAVNEDNAIQGLRLFSDLTGRYPEKPDMMAVMSQMGNVMLADTPAAKRLREEMKGMKPDEMGRKIADLMLPIQGISTFHMTLVGEKKEPAYYGQVVGPQDADKVLIRWKVSETEYRVIFGDLHTQTISVDVLAELEKTLPK